LIIQPVCPPEFRGIFSVCGLFRLPLVFSQIHFSIYDFNAFRLQQPGLLHGASEGKTPGRFTLCIHDAVAWNPAGIGIPVKRVSDRTGPFSAAGGFRNLGIGRDIPGGDFLDDFIDPLRRAAFFGHHDRILSLAFFRKSWYHAEGRKEREGNHLELFQTSQFSFRARNFAAYSRAALASMRTKESKSPLPKRSILDSGSAIDVNETSAVNNIDTKGTINVGKQVQLIVKDHVRGGDVKVKVNLSANRLREQRWDGVERGFGYLAFAYSDGGGLGAGVVAEAKNVITADAAINVNKGSGDIRDRTIISAPEIRFVAANAGMHVYTNTKASAVAGIGIVKSRAFVTLNIPNTIWVDNTAFKGNVSLIADNEYEGDKPHFSTYALIRLSGFAGYKTADPYLQGRIINSI